MGRFLAIDYGSKRCGIAVSDPLKMIASGLETVLSHELMTFLEAYLKKEDVECVVIGKAVQMDGTPSESFVLAERFMNALRKKFPDLRAEWEDERFTSVIAERSLIDGGMKKNRRRDKAQIDKVSAAIILQSFMEKENNKS